MSNRRNLSSDNEVTKPLAEKVRLPFTAFRYLANDRSYGNLLRFSKIQAFVDIVEHEPRYCQNGKGTTLNISNLAKRWNWARPTVIAYVNILQEMGVLLVQDSKDGKRIVANPKILPSVDCGEDLTCEANRGSSRSQSPCPHISSNQAEDKVARPK